MKRGSLIISLDCELFWGMSDKTTLADYGKNILGARAAVPRMLELFERYEVGATWAVVGMMTFGRKEELLAALPSVQPRYTDARLSTYEYLAHADIGEDETSDPYHFGESLVREVMQHPRQEIGSHTFSHYYCREEGQDETTFRMDIAAEAAALARLGRAAKSLVLPRNQWRPDYLDACREAGITAFRGNQRAFIYAARDERAQTNPIIRLLRLVDQYLPVFGHHVAYDAQMKKTMPRNIPASLFLRPYNPRLAFLEPLRRARFKAAMTKAAKTGGTFHLWWHPHNFGLDTDKNLATLEELLKHFAYLRTHYGMQSQTMGERAMHLL